MIFSTHLSGILCSLFSNVILSLENDKKNTFFNIVQRYSLKLSFAPLIVLNRYPFGAVLKCRETKISTQRSYQTNRQKRFIAAFPLAKCSRQSLPAFKLPKRTWKRSRSVWCVPAITRLTSSPPIKELTSNSTQPILITSRVVLIESVRLTRFTVKITMRDTATLLVGRKKHLMYLWFTRLIRTQYNRDVCRVAFGGDGACPFGTSVDLQEIPQRRAFRRRFPATEVKICFRTTRIPLNY